MKKLPLLPDGRPIPRLELDRVKIRLRLRERSVFRFHHGGVLHGLMCRVFGHELPPGLYPLALESGHVAYAPGDAYDFGVAVVGRRGPRLGGLEPALAALARQPRRLGAATLEGNFDLEGCESIPSLALDEIIARAEDWERRGSVRIVFPAPLRLRLPAHLQRPGMSHANRSQFPPLLFLERLWRRFCQLEDGEFPVASPVAELRSEVIARVEELIWLDMPVRGRLEGQPGKEKGMVLGGVVGAVVLEGLPLPWLLTLSLMESAGVGRSMHYGFGTFAVDEIPKWRRAARTYEEILAEKATDARAAMTALTPAALAILDDGAAFFRSGLSRFSASEGLRRARRAGMSGLVAGAGTRFVSRLDEERIQARLVALWPGEPLIERIRGWIGQRDQGTGVAKFLGMVFAEELARGMTSEDKRLVRLGAQLRVFGREEARVA